MRRILLGFLLLLLLMLTPDSLGLTPVGELAASQTFSLLSWEVRSFPEKWLYRVLHPTSPGSHEERLADLNRYFELGGEQRRLEEQLTRVAAETGGSSQETQATQWALQQIMEQRDSLRRRVEEFLEGELSALLREEGLLMKLLGVQLQFPPVDIRFTEPPRVLITSPRDQIHRLTDYLMSSSMTTQGMEALEEEILEEHDLSALVEGLGGVATYPAAIPSTSDLRSLLRVSAHEWLHHYLWFLPLGRSYSTSGEMRTLNESLASLVGDGLGDMLFVRLGAVLPPESPPSSPTDSEVEEGFNFNREMRRTRTQVDEMLADGRVEEAELYMEERRQFMVENGFFIRRLNQAYFAFHGTYADSPASVSPVADQLRSLRQRYGSLGALVKVVAQVGKFEEFQRLLSEAGVGDS